MDWPALITAQPALARIPPPLRRLAVRREREGSDGAITLTQTRKAWAAELGLTHEALYRALRKLRDDGTLAIAGERIAIVQRAGGQN